LRVRVIRGLLRQRLRGRGMQAGDC
jgi:hypothetical protein